MMDLTRSLQSLQKQVNVQTNIEQPSAALTLTRSATLAITTAGTVITWQVENRNQGFTWSGTTITIPTTGFYLFNFVFKISTANQVAYAEFSVNGLQQSFMGVTPQATNTKSYTQMLYCTTGDAVTLTVYPTSNDIIAVSVEGLNRPSPILHITQLTGAI